MLSAKPGPKIEPIASSFIASLVHTDRTASVWGVRFSEDGKRIFAFGYPSGVVQVFDVASQREVRKIETPRGYRSSADYAMLTPDWKTLYVPVLKRSVSKIVHDGKKITRIEHSGQVRVWDMGSGKEREPLLPETGSGPVYAKLTPDGHSLLCVERAGLDAGGAAANKDVTFICDLATGKKRKLYDGFAAPAFAPDGKTLVVRVDEADGKKSGVKLLEFATGNELAKLTSPDDRIISFDTISPDGSTLAAYLGGKRDATLEVWFLDARTLEPHGKLKGEGDPERRGWGRGIFTPNSKQYIAIDGKGNLLVWDLCAAKLVRTFRLGGDQSWGQMAVSHDSKFLAVGWMPRYDREVVESLNPDPRDLPQPRVSLFELSGEGPPRILIAPHGFVGGVAFSPDGKTLAFGGAGAVHLFDLTK